MSVGGIKLLIDKYRDSFREVVSLAKKRRMLHDENSDDSITKISITDHVYDESDVELKSYLMSLDFEAIKVVQTVMYLGRDKDYNESLEPRDIYLKERQYFDNHIGWKTKEVEVNQVVEKLPLDEYLEDGFEILSIKL